MTYSAKFTVLKTIGDTPLIKLSKIVPKDAAEVWLKLECFNPTGSYKDRMAIQVIDEGLRRGLIAPRDTLVEYTGGSTGTSLAFVAAAYGMKFIAISSDAFAPSKIKTMIKFGAQVIIEPSHNQGITPELIQRMKIRAMEMANKADHHYVDQFGSLEVLNGYIPMGMEMAKEMKGKIDVFCTSVGTGGALMGATKGLNISGVHPKIIALEPLQSPLISTGKGGAHKVDGIGIGFYPPFLDRTKIHEVQTIDQHDAFNMCELLAKEEGVFCGTSTGMNVYAAIEIAKKLGPNRKVLTLACDSGYKYL